MVADAIRDVSKRGEIVLDLFGGSGSTLIAAHKTGRRACLASSTRPTATASSDRWEIFAKDDAEHVACGLEGYAASRKRNPAEPEARRAGGTEMAA